MIYADLGIVVLPVVTLVFLARGDLQAAVVGAVATLVNFLLWTWGRRRRLHSIWPSKDR